MDELCGLLRKQIELVQQGSGDGHQIEALSRQADALVADMVRSAGLHSTEFAGRQEQIERLYKDLELALTAHKAHICKELGRVRKGRKTVKTYRSNI